MVPRPIAFGSYLDAHDTSPREVFDALDAVLDADARPPCNRQRDALAKDEWQLTQVVTDPPVELAKGNSD